MSGLSKDTHGTWIVDSGRGITVEALRIGGTNKECWMRGYYGEGLKLAASHLDSQSSSGLSFHKDRWSSDSLLCHEKDQIPGSLFCWEDLKKRSMARKFSYLATRQTRISWRR